VRATLSPGDELFFIIGADAFAEIQTWRRWQDVARSVCFLVASRPGHTYDIPAAVYMEALDGLDLAASSSSIREVLAAGEAPVEIPKCVLTYINATNLYRGRTAQPVCPTATDVEPAD
jgi:nicotinate-nucleotide adenylyltransferase